MPWRRWAVLILSLLLARYLFWRASSTLNFSSPAVAGLSLPRARAFASTRHRSNSKITRESGELFLPF